MVIAPENWDYLYGREGTRLEIIIRIDVSQNLSTGAAVKTLEYGNADISSAGVTLEHRMFPDLSVGNACAAMLTFTLVNPRGDANIILAGQRVRFSVRLVNGAQESGEANQGTFYIDTVTKSNDGGVTVTAYDAFNELSKKNVGMPYSGGVWAASFAAWVYNRIHEQWVYHLLFEDAAGEFDNSFANDARIGNVLIPESLADSNIRDVLASISAFAGANLTIDKRNDTHLVAPSNVITYTEQPQGPVISGGSLMVGQECNAISGVNLSASKGGKPLPRAWYIEGHVQVDFYPTADDEAAAFEYLREYNGGALKFDGVTVQNATLTPLAELGDTISVDMGDNGYLNFTLSGYRMTYYAGSGGYYCIGEAGFDRSDNAVKIDIDPSSQFAIDAPAKITDGTQAVFSGTSALKVSKVLADMEPGDYEWNVMKILAGGSLSATLSYTVGTTQITTGVTLCPVEQYYEVTDERTQSYSYSASGVMFAVAFASGRVPIGLRNGKNVSISGCDAFTVKLIEVDAGSSGTRPPGSPLPNQERGVGLQKTESASGMDIAHYTNTNICSVTLSPGIWLVTGRIRFETNATGVRTAKLSTTSADTSSVISTTSMPGFSNMWTHVTSIRCFSLAKQTTIYLVGWQNSGATLECNGEVEVTKIG